MPKFDPHTKNAKIWPPDTHIFYPLYNFLPPIQNDNFETPYTKNGIFETPHNKKLYFLRSPYTTKWQFRDPHILKIVFSRPPYTNKWHFPDPLYNKIGDRGMRKLEISRPPYKNVSSRPPNTTKWHFWDPPYANKCIYETTHIIQQNGIFKTPHRKNAFLRPPIQ